MFFDKWLTAGVGILAFAGGFTAANLIGDLRLKEVQNSHLAAMTEAQKQNEQEIRRREEAAQAAVDTLLEKLSAADRRNRDLSDDAVRLREQLKHSGGRAVSATAGDCAGACEKRLARCSSLLGEGVELLSEGSGICERIAVRKDAIRDIRK